MEEDSGDIGFELSSSNLSAKQEEAIALLYADRELKQSLGRLAYGFRQGLDDNDLRQELALKLIGDGSVLDDVKCLRSWLYTAAVNICRNDYRHTQVVNRHREKCVGESTLGRMRGGAVVLQRPVGKTPEQRLYEREQGAQLADRLRGFLDTLPEDVREVARMWDEGMSPAEIGEAIGRSVATVYRHHEEFQRALVKQSLAGGAEPDKEQLREVVDDLSRLAFVA